VRLGLLYMLGVVVLWSIIPILMKWLLVVFDPFTVAFLRQSQAAAVVVAAYALRGRRLGDLRLSRWHLIGGLGVTVNYACFAWSMSLTTASAGVLIVQVQYVTLTLLAAAVLREPLGLRQTAGMAAALAGVAAVVLARSDVGQLVAPDQTRGNVIMLFAGLGWGVYALCNKVLAQRVGTLAALLPILAIGAILTGVLAALNFAVYTPPTTFHAAIAVSLGAGATGGAFILLSKGMERLSAALLGGLTTISPVIAIILACLILDERPSWGLLLGGGVILAGIANLVRGERRAARGQTLT